MERYVMNKLVEWKNKPGRKPLILKGARQVGKTWLMKEFGKRHFKYTAYVNFDNNDKMLEVFEMDYNIERILMAINIETGVKILPQDTLIIFELRLIPSCAARKPATVSSGQYFSLTSSGHCDVSIKAAGSVATSATGAKLTLMP